MNPESQALLSRFLTAKELKTMPSDTTPYLVHNLLPAAGTSIWGSVPKLGKSTIARQLIAAVANGEEFLGRPVTQGAAIYLALEEQQDVVQGHFDQLGASDNENIHVLVGALEEGNKSLTILGEIIEHFKAKLVVIDPMFKFMTGFDDEHKYSQMSNVLEPYLTLARESQCHIALLHHTKKRVSEEKIKSLIGSMALAGGVDTIVYFTKTANGDRWMSTDQKRGGNMIETRLIWHKDTCTYTIGETSEEEQEASSAHIRSRIETDLRAFIQEKPNSRSQEIIKAIKGKGTLVQEVFYELCEDGILVRTGTGRKGDPKLYSLAELPAELAASGMDSTIH